MVAVKLPSQVNYNFYKISSKNKIFLENNKTFIYNITLIIVMDKIIERIFGKVEIETIIKRIKGKGLKQTERNYLSRSIRPKLIAARLLTEENILEKIRRPDRLLNNKILYNLSKYGYDMISSKEIKKQKTISLEELIAAIITKFPKPRYVEGIPVLILKNRTDKFKLAEIAYRYNIHNELGYLIETAKIIAKNRMIKIDLDDILAYLDNNKRKKIKYLGEEKDWLYMDFLSKTTPKRVRRWNLLGRFFDTDMIKTAEAYL